MTNIRATPRNILCSPRHNASVMFTHNTAGVPIIIACTIEDSINGLVSGEAFLGWVGW